MSLVLQSPLGERFDRAAPDRGQRSPQDRLSSLSRGIGPRVPNSFHTNTMGHRDRPRPWNRRCRLRDPGRKAQDRHFQCSKISLGLEQRLQPLQNRPTMSIVVLPTPRPRRKPLDHLSPRPRLHRVLRQRPSPLVPRQTQERLPILTPLYGQSNAVCLVCLMSCLVCG